jgi:hypothetical protein
MVRTMVVATAQVVVEVEYDSHRETETELLMRTRTLLERAIRQYGVVNELEIEHYEAEGRPREEVVATAAMLEAAYRGVAE